MGRLRRGIARVTVEALAGDAMCSALTIRASVEWRLKRISPNCGGPTSEDMWPARGRHRSTWPGFFGLNMTLPGTSGPQ